MKKYLLLTGSVMMLMASCTSEGVVNPSEVANDQETPMLFRSHKNNGSRAGETPLQNETYAFGVWAFKSGSPTATNPTLADLPTFTSVATDATDVNMVMNNYLVGYWNSPEGYKPEKGQAVTTNWYYDLLGNTQSGSTFATTQGMAEYTSAQANQFLKYWDKSKKSTFFFGYTPYGAASMATEANKATLSFGTVEAGGGDSHNYTYGAAVCNNAEYVGATKYVDITFQHILSQVRMAFYHTIPGYKVELVDYNAAGNGVVAVPAVAPTIAGDPYTLGSYTNKGSFSVVYEMDGANLKSTPTLVPSTEAADQVSTGLECPVDYFYSGATATKVLGTSTATKIVSLPYYVLPQDACGFTVNVSFKLTAIDTGEVIYIRGARVFVDPSYCKWATNTVYTYIFYLTTNAPGSTAADDPGDPSPNPTTNQALWPIIFDKVEVTPMSTVDVNPEFPINPLP